MIKNNILKIALIIAFFLTILIAGKYGCEPVDAKAMCNQTVSN